MADLSERELLESLRRRPLPRGFGVAIVAALVRVGVAADWALPAVQHLTQPAAGGGPSGTWVFLPDRICLIFSSALTPVWLSPLIARLVRRWFGISPRRATTVVVRTPLRLSPREWVNFVGLGCVAG
jgi:hypothetical protein